MTQENNQVQFDIRLPLMIALGTNDMLTSTINDLYKQNEKYYHDLYEEHYPNDLTATLFSVKYTKQIKQTFAVVQHFYLTNDMQSIFSLIKKGFNPVYRFVTQNKKISTIDIVKLLEKKQPFNMYSETELSCIHSVIIYLIAKGKARMEKAEFTLYALELERFINKIKNELLFSVNINDDLFTLKNFTEKQKEVFNQTFKQYTVDGKFNITWFLDEIIADEHAKELNVKKEELFTEKVQLKIPPHLIDQARTKIFSNGNTASIIGALSSFAKTFGFYEEQLDPHVFTKYETNMLFQTALNMYYNNGLHKKYSFEDILAIASYMVVLIKEKDLSNKLYEETFSDDIHLEYQAQFQETISALQMDLTRNKAEIEKLQKNKVNITQQNIEANAEIKRLTKELKTANESQIELEKLRKEVNSLRNFVYEQGLENDEANAFKETTIEEMITFINNQKVVIIGGHQNWQNKMKTRLTEATFIDIDKTGSFSAVGNEGYTVFLNTRSNKHANYTRLLNKIHPNNPLCYFNDIVNIELSIKEIYEQMKDV